MKALTTALQTLIAADSNFPVTAVTIHLTDGSTVLRVANVPITIASNPYLADLIDLPRILITEEDGLDHTEILLNNADSVYSAFDNQDDFDGAKCTIEQYYATDDTYTTLEGPVLAFAGTISQPGTSGSLQIRLVVMADARAEGEGSVGRVITGRCQNTFKDANCGYSHSATISSSGTITTGNVVSLNGTLLNGQKDLGALPLQSSPFENNTLEIRRGSPTGTLIHSGLKIVTSELFSGVAGVRFNQDVTVAAGDFLVYELCPRDSMHNCARRWQIGNADRQQDHYMGFRELRNELSENGRGSQAKAYGAYGDLFGQVIPVPYGQRWVRPTMAYVHSHREHDDWPSWQTTNKGPFVTALIGEGPVDTGIEDPQNEVELDGEILKNIAAYEGGPASFVDVQVGTDDGAISDFFPKLVSSNQQGTHAGEFVPAFAAQRGVAYMVLDLPDDTEIGSVFVTGFDAKRPFAFNPLRSRSIWTFTKPDLRIRYKGREVRTWTLPGGVPTPGPKIFSKNPYWQLIDLLTSPPRAAESDRFSVGLADSDLDLISFIQFAQWADDPIAAFDSNGDAITPPRFECDLYIQDQDRATAIQEILDTCRSALVVKNGKIGVTCDCPLGGKGTATAGTTTTIVDTRRTDTSQPQYPKWPDTGANGLLEGLTVKILSGTGAGQTSKITANTKNQIAFSPPMAVAPDATSEYAIYAVELTKSNSGNVTRSKPTASHDLTNRVIVEFESDAHRGQPALLPVVDTQVDGNGDTHVGRFGVNELRLPLAGTTSYQQAARLGWYALRRALDTNRHFQIDDINIEGVPIEVGDIVLLTHPIDGVDNEVVRVIRIEDTGQQMFSITARLYREHIYSDWPTDKFEGLDISSNLIPPSSVPPHVTNLFATLDQESLGDQPLIVCTYDLPRWPYAGWSVVIEARYEVSPGVFGPWRQQEVSTTGTASFRSAKVALYDIRAVFVSHLNVRADDPRGSGTASGGGASTLTDNLKDWETDWFQGDRVLITAGTAINEEEEVASNTPDTLTTVSPWAVVPDATSVYQIYLPAPVFQLNVATGVLTSITGWIRAVADEATGTADLTATITGPPSVFPVTGAIYEDDPQSAPIQSHSFLVSGDTIGPTGSGETAEYAALTDIALPVDVGKQFWFKGTTAGGDEVWVGFTVADVDKKAGGSVTLVDFVAAAQIAVLYDDDVTDVVVTTPSGPKSYTGLSGGGKVTYTVGDQLDNHPTPPPESLLNTDETRVGYLVDVSNATSTKRLFDGPLHGAATAVSAAWFHKLRAAVDATAGTTDIFCEVGGVLAAFPIDVEIYEDDPTGPILQSHTFAAAGEIGPVQYATLDDITLPRFGVTVWYAKATDAAGGVQWIVTMADRNTYPNGAVTVDDYEVNPTFRCSYDDDVKQITIDIPGAPIKTFTGLSGGGVVTYQVGVDTYDGPAGPEADMTQGEIRPGYTVQYTADLTAVILFDGALHGPAQGIVAGPTLAIEADGRVRCTMTVAPAIASVKQLGSTSGFPAPTEIELPSGTKQLDFYLKSAPATDLVLAIGEQAFARFIPFTNTAATAGQGVDYDVISAVRGDNTGAQGGNWLILSRFRVHAAVDVDLIGLDVYIEFHVQLGPLTQSMNIEVWINGTGPPTLPGYEYDFNIAADGVHRARLVDGTTDLKADFDTFYEFRCRPYDAIGGEGGAGVGGVQHIISSNGVSLAATEALTHIGDAAGNIGVAHQINMVGALGLAATPSAAGEIDVGFSTEPVDSHATGNSLTPDIANGPKQKITANGHFTLNAPAAGFSAKHGWMTIRIDLGGSWTLTLDSVYKAGAGTAAKAAGVCYVSFYFFDTDEFITSINSDTTDGGV